MTDEQISALNLGNLRPEQIPAGVQLREMEETMRNGFVTSNPGANTILLALILLLLLESKVSIEQEMVLAAVFLSWCPTLHFIGDENYASLDDKLHFRAVGRNSFLVVVLAIRRDSNRSLGPPKDGFPLSLVL